jgi:single-strand DNA-binding protein
MPTSQLSAEPSAARGGSGQHRNEVTLVGELRGAPQDRLLPDGTEVSSFVLLVRADERGSDSIDCVARLAPLRQKIVQRGVGDALEVTGALRHRFWRGATGLMSRYEVEARKITLRRRAAPADRRSGE